MSKRQYLSEALFIAFIFSRFSSARASCRVANKAWRLGVVCRVHSHTLDALSVAEAAMERGEHNREVLRFKKKKFLALLSDVWM